MDKLCQNIYRLSQRNDRLITSRWLNFYGSSNITSKHHRFIASLPRRRLLVPLQIAITSRNFADPRQQQHLANSRVSLRNMSDADYAAFLDKANQDTGSVEQQSTSKKSYGTKSVDTAVPKVLEQVEAYYTSDADEPFEPVSLKFSGSDLSAGNLKKLLGGDKDVEEVQQKNFDSQYKQVVDAVKQAGNGKVKVFKVDLDHSRAEYYVVSVDEKEGKVVGLKALSVES